MKKLYLKLQRHSSIDTFFLVDNKKIKFKKDDFGSYVSEVETDKDEVEVKIVHWNEYKSKLWFLTNLLFYIISIFDLLDIRIDKKFRSVEFVGKVKLTDGDNVLKLRYDDFKDNAVAILHEGSCEVNVIENKYFIDNVCKKRYKVMRWVKFGIFIIAIIGIILLLR